MWDLLLFNNYATNTYTKDEGLFLVVSGTFEDENIWAIGSGASRHMIGEHKKLNTLSRGKYSLC